MYDLLRKSATKSDNTLWDAGGLNTDKVMMDLAEALRHVQIPGAPGVEVGDHPDDVGPRRSKDDSEDAEKGPLTIINDEIEGEQPSEV